NKSVALAIVGQRNPVEGLRIIAAHIDSPRLDLKGNPLYEETDYNLALMKTHYYGGIRKYQWVTIPLAIHGVVFTKKGNRVEIKIGENDDDPVFVITDLLPHVARKSQGERKLEEGIKGEELNLVVGHRPIDEKKAKKKIKLWVLNYLNEKYGITEEDFVSAELEVVPALRARDAGFDRMLVAGYGQDDRICAYTQLKAFLEVENPLDTCLALFFDKEEIGSEGNSSVKSRFFDYIVATLVEKCSSVKKRGRGRPRKEEKQQEASESLLLRIMKCLNSSIALSSDVNAAMDPTFRDPWEPMNCSRIGGGVVITKYTGHGGKSGASDANAEFMHYIRTLLNQEEITWQIGELGKVDEGGGGTVAKFLAAYNMDIVDCGPALLAMHAPVELSSKVDILSAYRLYKAFCLDKSKPSK
ncbi:MAG: aminopeptidase, partial [Thermoplasmata archaeon]